MYRVYEKVRDKYVIQNIETLEIELVDEKTYKEGLLFGLIEDYVVELRSMVTTKLITNEEVLFITNKYYLAYNSYDECVDINYNYGSIGEDDLLLYIPSVISNVEFNKCNVEVKKLILVASNLKEKICFSRLNIKYLDLQYMDTSQLKYMNSMFENLDKTIYIDVSNFNTSNIVDMQYMFLGCKSLRKLNVSHFDTSKVTTMKGMFYKCSLLKEIDVSNFNISSLETVELMFYACTNIEKIIFFKNKFQHIVSFSNTFSMCFLLKQLNLSSVDMSMISDLRNCFYNCDDLKTTDNEYLDKELGKNIGID